MADRSFSQIFVAVGAIIERDKKILLVREAGNHPDSGKWTQPAGWVDVGEDPTAAVSREVLEETGMEFVPKSLIGVYSTVREDLTHIYGNPVHGVKLIYRGEVVRDLGREADDEIAELGWFSLDEIKAMGQSVLRSTDIIREVEDYFAGREYPLELVRHTVQGVAKN